MFALSNQWCFKETFKKCYNINIYSDMHSLATLLGTPSELP